MLKKFKQFLKNILHKADVDRAVFFVLLGRIWNIICWPITALLIIARFTPEIQGYYYTFASLLALQVFVELGLGTVIVQFASHEWSQLSLDKSGKIVGDKDALSRLISLAQVSLKWFAVAAMVLICGLGIGGYIFFSKSPDIRISWALPWLMLCVLTGISVFLTPVWSLLEGCNQVVNLYTNRFKQSLSSNISIWIAILCGAKLWTASISILAIFICAGIFLKNKYYFFLKILFFSRPGRSIIRWRKDILPMQWRLAISWVSGYLAFSLFTPVLFHYHGPAIAGQMGMTWALVGALLLIASSWLNPKVPQFGMLIAQKKYKELDKLFWRTTRVIAIAAISGAIGIWCIVYILNIMKHPLATRFLPLLPTGIFLVSQVILIMSVPFSAYLRAHKKEPLLFLSLLVGISIGLSTLILGKLYSAMGIAIGYLSVNIVLVPVVTIIWYRCRIEWHKDGTFKPIINEDIETKEVSK